MDRHGAGGPQPGSDHPGLAGLGGAQRRTRVPRHRRDRGQQHRARRRPRDGRRLDRGTSFVCEIHDAGHIVDPLAGRHRPAPDQDGGRGLWMANQLCDLVQIRSTKATGTTVRLTPPSRRTPAARDPVVGREAHRPILSRRSAHRAVRGPCCAGRRAR
ncbi:ATP-binding protein [Embleya scabrispora]|uniref:ATP-binding protein n=1 Tax=Embleya scabrispora TaxID=159449 RepID=UPI003CCC3818